MNISFRIRNMALGSSGFPIEYKIKYYSPYDQVNSIKEETKWGPKLTLDFPEMDTLDIVLFEAFLMGDDFKSMSNDSTNREVKTSSPSNYQSTEKVLVYPNPNDGSFTVKLQSTTDVENIEVVDQLGNLVKTKRDIQEVNHFNNLNLSNGVYWVKVVFHDTITYKKVVVH
ncbi:MAG: T9SS type A sorting domain-containing protein [Bacteroidota bacterium]